MSRPVYDYNKVQNRNNRPAAPKEILEDVEEVLEEVEEAVEVEEVKPEPKQGTIYKCKAINLRCKPSLDSEIVTVLHNGDKVEIDEEDGDWYAVVTQMGVEGYCLKDYVEV